jgi:protoporphyrinogen oxidase
MKRIVIIGAGLAGLGAAYALRGRADEYSVTLLEREDKPGGLCRTIGKDGFLFDKTGHLLHFQTEHFKQLVLQKLSPGLVECQRNSWVYSHGVFTRYPFQANLHGLPPEVIADCVYGYCEEYFCRKKKKVTSFEDWIRRHFGSGIAKNFLIPYNAKLYKRPPSELTPDCAGRFIPRPDLLQVIRGAISDSQEKMGYNSSFYYPERGGIETLVRALLPEPRSLRTGQEVRSIDAKGKRVITSTGDAYEFDSLVSSAPLPVLVRMFPDVPPAVQEASDSLEHVSVLNINLGVRGFIKEKHWIYVPEDRFIFYRVGFAHNFSKYMAPEGCSSIYTEISYRPERPPDIEDSVGQVIADLIAMKIIQTKGDVMTRMVIDIPCAYIIFNKARVPALRAIRRFLTKNRVFSIGRYGRWDYMSMEDSFLDGMTTAGALNEEGR